MIERVVIRGYRRFGDLDVEPTAGMNIIVGDNESGKSTLLEAIALALTGKLNGRWAIEELNPFWFNRKLVSDFFDANHKKEPRRLPEIVIELYLRNDDALQSLRGVHNSLEVDCPGVRFYVGPSPDYETEFANYLASGPPPIVPVEFYDVEWRHFGDLRLSQRPKELGVALIDARTIRSTSGIDYHTREMLTANLDAGERAAISIEHRRARQDISERVLASINDRIERENASLHEQPIGLQMDQSWRASWESGVVPQVDGIPFAMAGQGQQAAVKVALAMSRSSTSTYVLMEEPENHLSYTGLVRLLSRVESLAGEDQQLFVTTHSSFVVNRLGLDRLVLLHEGRPVRLGELGADTVDYFRKLPGYDTLRLVLAEKLALVEGPSDAIVLERAFRDAVHKSPLEAGVDIVSMGGLTFKRALEVCSCLGRQAVALQDNDGVEPDTIEASVEHLLEEGRRVLLVSNPALGRTLEPQLGAVNEDSLLREVLGLSARADIQTWMRNNKAEAALRILDSPRTISYPSYIQEAVSLLK
ncbi:MAG: AAA family ATPase [Actinomycetota bacterium]|nr:AAA family ATPase [Actinomycetota bacterium]MDQ3954452.1 AAA family ATPase [Actinomycetota bacterium]